MDNQNDKFTRNSKIYGQSVETFNIWKITKLKISELQFLEKFTENLEQFQNWKSSRNFKTQNFLNFLFLENYI